jgi:PBP1b-binding outer membrane lipoprotein LpoB
MRIDIQIGQPEVTMGMRRDIQERYNGDMKVGCSLAKSVAISSNGKFAATNVEHQEKTSGNKLNRRLRALEESEETNTTGTARVPPREE